ncbi:hypothetical protein DM860_016462 [Cuscuta australis]|uniref:Uncharacterized protein n=1 Tax=Cuscuta australis TaxID=267555 RepID=A0A328DFG4_9ASTE|nr:hypothetical protein DM860_016462 [Cuscuta australis]
MEAQLKIMEDKFTGIEEKINAQDMKLDQIMLILKKSGTKSGKEKEVYSSSGGDKTYLSMPLPTPLSNPTEWISYEDQKGVNDTLMDNECDFTFDNENSDVYVSEQTTDHVLRVILHVELRRIL